MWGGVLDNSILRCFPKVNACQRRTGCREQKSTETGQGMSPEEEDVRRPYGGGNTERKHWGTHTAEGPENRAKARL